MPPLELSPLDVVFMAALCLLRPILEFFRSQRSLYVISFIITGFANGGGKPPELTSLGLDWFAKDSQTYDYRFMYFCFSHSSIFSPLTIEQLRAYQMSGETLRLLLSIDSQPDYEFFMLRNPVLVCGLLTVLSSGSENKYSSCIFSSDAFCLSGSESDPESSRLMILSLPYLSRVQNFLFYRFLSMSCESLILPKSVVISSSELNFSSHFSKILGRLKMPHFSKQQANGNIRLAMIGSMINWKDENQIFWNLCDKLIFSEESIRGLDFMLPQLFKANI